MIGLRLYILSCSHGGCCLSPLGTKERPTFDYSGSERGQGWRVRGGYKVGRSDVADSIGVHVDYIHGIEYALMARHRFDVEEHKKEEERESGEHERIRAAIEQLTVKEEQRIKDLKTYFVLDEARQLVKIGISANVNLRLRNLSMACGSELTLLHTQDGNHEKHWHMKFARHRVKGEWFQYTEEIRSTLGTCKE